MVWFKVLCKKNLHISKKQEKILLYVLFKILKAGCVLHKDSEAVAE